MFDSLSDKLEKAFKTLKGAGQITEINVSATIKQIRRALIDADVNYAIAKEVTDRVKVKAMGQNVIKSLKPGELFTKIVHEELTELMGGKVSELDTSGRPTKILIAGLQGSGKTTFSGKLALKLKSTAGRVLLVAGDVYRPAAIEQLKVLGEQIKVDVYFEEGVTDVVAIAQRGVEKADKEGYKIVIVDTAGRLAVDEEMMDEIGRVHQAIQPSETLFVVDSMTGQDAVNTAKAFNDKLNFDGVVLTKLDGDARGGAALSISYTVGKPIKFIGTGEKLEALDVFYPDRMANRILGMGDVISLVERVQQQFDEEEAARLEKKIAKNKFDFEDFMGQIQQIKKMGNIKDLLGMIPGASKMMKNIDIDDDAFKEIESIINSMTPFERQNPEVIDGSRRKRIAKGAGHEVQKINQLMKQFDQMKKMMQQMKGAQGGKGGRGMKMPFG